MNRVVGTGGFVNMGIKIRRPYSYISKYNILILNYILDKNSVVFLLLRPGRAARIFIRDTYGSNSDAGAYKF